MAYVDSDDLERRLQLSEREFDARIARQTSELAALIAEKGGEAAAQMRERTDELTRLVQDNAADSAAQVQEQSQQILAETDRRWKRRWAVLGPTVGAGLTLLGYFGLPATIDDLKTTIAERVEDSLKAEVTTLERDIESLRDELQNDVVQIRVQTELAQEQSRELGKLAREMENELEKVKKLQERIVSFRKDIDKEIAGAMRAAKDAKRKTLILNEKLSAASKGHPVVFRTNLDFDDPKLVKITASGVNLGECCGQIKFSLGKFADGKDGKFSEHEFNVVKPGSDAGGTKIEEIMDRLNLDALAQTWEDKQLEIAFPKHSIKDWVSDSGTLYLIKNMTVITNNGEASK